MGCLGGGIQRTRRSPSADLPKYYFGGESAGLAAVAARAEDALWNVSGPSKRSSLFLSKAAGRVIYQYPRSSGLSDVDRAGGVWAPHIEGGRAGKKVAAVLIPEKVDRGTDERDNITVDMRNRANEYEFQKLNADFDKKLDRLSEEYKRKADEIFRADRDDLYMEKKRNRLWMWFDRKTRYQIVPKIVIFSFILTLALVSFLLVLFIRYDIEMLFSINLPAVFLISGLLLMGEIPVLLRVLRELTGYPHRRDMSLDIVTNPAWKNLKCNVWHRETDE